MRDWFRRVVLARRGVTFVVMGVSFLLFGLGTFNLFMLLKANADLLTEYGWQAVMDGGLTQLFYLIVTGYVSLAAYVIFKTCEHALVHHFADDDSAASRDDEED